MIICLCFLLSGCGDKVATVTNPNGDSKTYQFFIKADYSQSEYNVKFKNEKRDIEVIHSDGKNYYRVSDENDVVTDIEKDGKKYTLKKSSMSYTVEPIVGSSNYILGYLPMDMEVLKTQKYKTGKERIGFTKYVFEQYVYDGGTTTYYFKRDKLKFIKNETPLNETMVEFISVSTKINDNKFEIPKGYQELVN